MGRKSGIYPNTWRSGPDPIDHRLFNDCQRARAQAWYRGEQWFITEQEYIALWRTNDYYLRKGRHNEDLCLIRRHYDLPWSLDNVQIVTRLEHYKICSREKQGRCAVRLQRRQKALDHA